MWLRRNKKFGRTCGNVQDDMDSRTNDSSLVQKNAFCLAIMFVSSIHSFIGCNTAHQGPGASC
jgi:hypothetical protein